jgi:hypothetical protein
MGKTLLPIIGSFTKKITKPNTEQTTKRIAA